MRKLGVVFFVGALALSSVGFATEPDAMGDGRPPDSVAPKAPDRLARTNVPVAGVARPPLIGIGQDDDLWGSLIHGGLMPALCYDAAHPPSADVMAAIERMRMPPFATRFNDHFTRWGGSSGNQNLPAHVTWSFVPDGTSVPARSDTGFPGGPSNLFSQMDGKFGGSQNRAVWIQIFTDCLTRWQALTGITFERITYNGNAWDDGAPIGPSNLGGSLGSPGLRGDIRIGCHALDGTGAVLAYADYPGLGGDLILDETEDFGNTGNNYRYMRDVVSHELGHAIGLQHVCPADGTKLMEPYLNLGIDRQRHDDIRGVQLKYGDAFEPNNYRGQAYDLGTIAPIYSLHPSQVPGVSIPYCSAMSLADGNDQDWFKVRMLANLPLRIQATPLGLTYESGAEGPPGTCNPGNIVDSLRQLALRVRVQSEDGTTISSVDSATTNGPGDPVFVTTPTLVPGNYYIAIDNSAQLLSPQVQMYDLDLNVDLPPRPSNDLCANAATIGIGTTTGTTLGAFYDGYPLCGAGQSFKVWYRFVPACSGILTATSCSAVTSTFISLHSACPNGATNQIDCNIGSIEGPCGGPKSTITDPVTSGTAYWIAVGGLDLTTANFSLTLAVTPPNDLCANAVPLSPGSSQTVSTCGAGSEAASSCVTIPSGADVWYSYTPSCSHTLTVDTSGSNFDTVLSVYTGSCGALTEIACDDDSGPGNTSLLSTQVVAGATYLIRASGYNGATGLLHITLGIVAQSNDLCANALTITAPTTFGGTCTATRDRDVSCSIGGFAGDVWYRWIPTCSGFASLDTCGSSFDTVLSLHSGSCGALTEIACNDDHNGQADCTSMNAASFLRAHVVAGTVYTIRVSGYGSTSGSFALNIKSPSNDDCQHAAPIGLGITTGSTVCASANGAGLPVCGDSAGSRDLWYSLTPTCRGEVWVDLCPSDFDTIVQVFSGSCGSLTAVACDDDRGAAGPPCDNTRSFVAFRPVPGTAYTIRVAGYAGVVGQASMLITCCPADFNLSGSVNVQDIFDFLNAWFAGDPSGDVDGANGLQVADVFAFLNAWFAGCR